jgi:hypothetical protein
LIALAGGEEDFLLLAAFMGRMSSAITAVMISDALPSKNEVSPRSGSRLPGAPFLDFLSLLFMEHFKMIQEAKNNECIATI